MRMTPLGDPVDPFDEQQRPLLRRRADLLGATFEFLADDEPLLAPVDAAYAGVPPQRLGGGPALQVRLRRGETAGWPPGLDRPPAARHLSGAGVFGVALDAVNMTLVMPELGRALVTLSPELLDRPLDARMELVECAVYQLAARAQGLHALHAGAVALDGRAALLIGHSGAGKSTLTLHAMLQGLAGVTEDGAFLDPTTLRVTGVPNFLHLRTDSLDRVDDAATRARLAASPVIRRRSGAEKFELDLRGGWLPLAATPPVLGLLVFLSPTPAPGADPWRPLAPAEVAARLATTQPYAAWRPGWQETVERCAHLPAFELARGRHPRETAADLRRLLGGAGGG
ncbi:hypothetical protein ACFJIX_16310 [Roseateles sp. UC29_93]|uniref:hypothetical protein n=1 Tax=Roseateles sp. UC29_93 TaxID=3350177 RepID=UPI00366FEE5A